MRNLLANSDLLRWAFSIGVPALSGFVGVVLGAWLTARRERVHRRYEFRVQQLRDFYSPLLGLRAEVRARGEHREHIHGLADAAWQRLCSEARQGRDNPEELLNLQRNRWPEFEAVIRYDDRQLAEQLVPTCRKMLLVFRDNLWLAEPETRSYFGELLKFVDVWDGWLANSIPVEVVNATGQKEASLQPLYQHLESTHDELRNHLSKGVL